MKQTYTLLTLILAILILTPTQAQGQLGIAAGLNYDELSDISGNREAAFDNASGYHVGVFYDLSLATVGLRVGAFYRDAGDVDVSISDVDDTFALTSWDFPVDIRFNLSATPVIRPYVMVGPVFSFPSSGADEYDGALEDVSISGNIGAGLELSLGSIRLYPEFRYSIGVSRFMKDKFSIGGVEFDADEIQRQNSVMLRLGIGF